MGCVGVLLHFRTLLVKRKGKFVSFNDASRAHCFSYHWLFSVKHVVTAHISLEETPVSSHRLIFPISHKRSFICTFTQTGQHLQQPLMAQLWLERKIVQTANASTMQDQSDYWWKGAATSLFLYMVIGGCLGGRVWLYCSTLFLDGFSGWRGEGNFVPVYDCKGWVIPPCYLLLSRNEKRHFYAATLVEPWKQHGLKNRPGNNVHMDGLCATTLPYYHPPTPNPRHQGYNLYTI